MSTLQKVVLGTPPTAVDGDTSRDGFSKGNANVDVLSKQATLTSTAALIVAPQALTAAHVGTRVSINLAANGTINLPAASTCANDQVIHLRNLGATLVTLAITTGSGDTIGLATLAAGESASFDTDGVHAWRALLRGRSINANESVAGNLTVGGTVSLGGTLSGLNYGLWYGSSPTTNAPYAAIQHTGATAILISSASGSGAPTPFALQIGAAEAWRVIPGGKLLIGTVGNNFPARVQIAYGGSQLEAGIALRPGVDGTVSAMQFYNAGGGQVGGITQTTTTTSFVTSSDYRLKQDVKRIDGDHAIDLVKRGAPSSFSFIGDPDRIRISGFIAHELQEVIPEAVHGEKDGMQPQHGEDADPDVLVPAYQGVDASKAVPTLWAALKRALERIDALEAAAK